MVGKTWETVLSLASCTDWTLPKRPSNLEAIIWNSSLIQIGIGLNRSSERGDQMKFRINRAFQSAIDVSDDVTDHSAHFLIMIIPVRLKSVGNDKSHSQTGKKRNQESDAFEHMAALFQVHECTVKQLRETIAEPSLKRNALGSSHTIYPENQEPTRASKGVDRMLSNRGMSVKEMCGVNREAEEVVRLRGCRRISRTVRRFLLPMGSNENDGRGLGVRQEIENEIFRQGKHFVQMNGWHSDRAEDGRQSAGTRPKSCVRSRVRLPLMICFLTTNGQRRFSIAESSVSSCTR